MWGSWSLVGIAPRLSERDAVQEVRENKGDNNCRVDEGEPIRHITDMQITYHS